MPESMDPKWVEQLNAICASYARQKRLSVVDQQELFDHLQDSLEGYLTGRTPVTPDDALLMARARLGDVKGVVAQLRPDRAARNWRVGLALVTGVLTVVIVPVAMLLISPPIGAPADIIRALTLLPLCFVPLEGGVFLSARADPQSTWQRITALILILPALLIFSLILTHTGTREIHTSGFNGLGTAVLWTLAIACLAGHGSLALMLMKPTKRAPEPALH